MTYEEIKAEVDAICAALVEKGLQDPRVQLDIRANEQPLVYLKHSGNSGHFDNRDFAFARGDTPSACLAAAWEIVNNLDDPKVAVAKEYTRKLSDAVDFAVLNAIPDDAVSPVRDAIRVVHDVLLPAPEAVE